MSQVIITCDKCESEFVQHIEIKDSNPEMPEKMSMSNYKSKRMSGPQSLTSDVYKYKHYEMRCLKCGHVEEYFR